jgi:YHS domain-containing protein
LLLLAVCPLAMLLMMRGVTGGRPRGPDDEGHAPDATVTTRDARIAELEAPMPPADRSDGPVRGHLLGDIAAAEDKTVVMVTNDNRITPGADRLLWLEDGRLRDRDTSFATVADPVCGMEVVIDRAAAKRMVPDTSGRGTRTLYFCSAVCATKFDADPARWLGGPAPGTRQSRDHPASDRDRHGDSPARR